MNVARIRTDFFRHRCKKSDNIMVSDFFHRFYFFDTKSGFRLDIFEGFSRYHALPSHCLTVCDFHFQPGGVFGLVGPEASHFW